MTVSEPGRVLVAGDIHGNSEWAVRHVLRAAKRRGASSILQLGDFGIWPGRDGRRFLDHLERETAAAGIPWEFVDGNHEDFDQLLAIDPGPDGRRQVRPHIWHLPRGYRWTWGGRTFLALGGAASPDQADRVPGRSWWPQEEITNDDVERCVAGGPIDVLVCHDAPLDVQRGGHWGTVPPEVAAKVRRSRERLQRVVDTCRPQLLLHGHWHVRHLQRVSRGDGGEYTVMGLTCDGLAFGDRNGHCALIEVSQLSQASHPGAAIRTID